MAMTLDEAKLIAKELAKAMGGSSGSRTPSTPTPAGLTDPAHLEAYQKAVDKINLSLSEQKDILKKQKEIDEQRLKITAEAKKLADAIKADDTGGIATAEEDLRLAKLKNKELEQEVELIRRAEDASKDLADSFGSIFSGQAPDLKGMLDPKNIQGMAQKLGDVAQAGKLSQMASQAAVAALFEYSKAAINLAIDLGDMESGFMKATGANQDLARSVTESYQETRKFGATAKETSESAQVLFNTFTDFTIASENTRKSLTETSAVLAKMGISNQDFAKSIQISTKALGMSADQAAQDMLNLEKFAENLGVAPQQLAADFAGAGDMLAKMGQDGTKAFKDLAIVAKTTGMQMESILAITNKFDTFEGAAAQAGKLNAALGGNFVNAMDLMMATDPAERFGMIRDSILDAGLSFGEMSYYQKNFYKESLGLKDVNELALMMSGNIDLMAGATQQSEQSMIDAAERARDMATMQEKLNMAFAQMIPIITPLIDAFSKMTSFIADNMNVIKPMIGVLIILASIIALVSGVGTAGGVAGLTLGLGILFDSVETGTDDLTLLGAIFEGIGDVFTFVGEAISYVSDMLGSLSDSINASISPEMMESLIGGAKFLGIVIGVVLVAAIGYLIFILGGLIAPFAGTLAIILAIGAAIYGLAVVLYETAFNPPNFLQGLIQIGEAFVGIAKSAMEILNPFNAIERAIRGIGETFSSILGGVSSFFTAITDPAGAENIAKIGKAISDVNVKSATAFTAAMTSTAAAGVAGTARAAVEGATETVNNLIFGSEKGKQGSQPQQITVNLMLDRTKLATIVKEINGESARDAIAGRT